MKFKFNRKDGEKQGGGGPHSAGPGGGGLSNLRREGQDFLSAGEDAVNRALSADSAAFLNASRQEGGE